MKQLSHKLNSTLCLTVIGLLLQGCVPSESEQSTESSESIEAYSFSFEKAKNPVDVPTTNKCIDIDAALIGMRNAKVALGGNAKTGSNVYLDEGASITMGGNATINGVLYRRSKNEMSLGGNAKITGGVQDTTVSVTDHLYLWSAKLASYQPTKHFSEITGSELITGNGGINIIAVEGELRLAGKDTLMLQGGSNDKFIINVYGKAQIAGSAQILVSGSVPPSNVVINIVSTERVSLAGNGTIYGSILAVRSDIQIGGNGRIFGAVSGQKDITIGGNGMTLENAAYCPEIVTPTPTPAPTPVATPTATPTPSPTPDVVTQPFPEVGAPQFSQVMLVERSFDFVQVSWTTDVASTSQAFVRDDVTGITEMTGADNELVTSHMLFINNLKPNHPYTIILISISADGKAGTSQPFPVQTLE